jgi:hypothetical protein
MAKKDTAPAPAAKKAAAKATGKEVAVKPKQEVGAASELDALLTQNAGVGFESVDAQDLAIPFLSIVQSNSPQRKKNHEKFIEGADEGDIFNTVTGVLFAPPVAIIPCGYKKVFIEWKPRDSGGGFVAQYDRHHPIIAATPPDERGKRILPNGNLLVETATFYVLVEVEEGEWEGAVISMTSTQLKKARKWNTLMVNKKVTVNGVQLQAPMFAYSYMFSSASESNDRGEWHGWTIEAGPQITSRETFLQAKSFHDAVGGGTVTADFSKVQEEEDLEETAY